MVVANTGLEQLCFGFCWVDQPDKCSHLSVVIILYTEGKKEVHLMSYSALW